MKITKESFLQKTKIIVLALLLTISITYLYSWTGPTANPPFNNALAPINASSSSQYKAGRLSLGTTTLPFGDSKLDVVGNMLTQGLAVSGASIFNGAVQVKSGSPSIGKVLTATDADGTLAWQQPSDTASPLAFSRISCQVPYGPATVTCPSGKILLFHSISSLGSLNWDTDNAMVGTVSGNYSNNSITCSLSTNNMGALSGVGLCANIPPPPLQVSCNFSTNTLILNTATPAVTPYGIWSQSIVGGSGTPDSIVWTIGQSAKMDNQNGAPVVDIAAGSTYSGNTLRVSYSSPSTPTPSTIKTASVTVVDGALTATANCSTVTVRDMYGTP